MRFHIKEWLRSVASLSLCIQQGTITPHMGWKRLPIQGEWVWSMCPSIPTRTSVSLRKVCSHLLKQSRWSMLTINNDSISTIVRWVLTVFPESSNSSWWSFPIDTQKRLVPANCLVQNPWGGCRLLWYWSLLLAEVFDPWRCWYRYFHL